MPVMKAFPFALYDAFSATVFGGSQAAIITDAKTIKTNDRQRIAREIGMPATAFVDDYGKDWIKAQFMFMLTNHGLDPVVVPVHNHHPASGGVPAVLVHLEAIDELDRLVDPLFQVFRQRPAAKTELATAPVESAAQVAGPKFIYLGEGKNSVLVDGFR